MAKCGVSSPALLNRLEDGIYNLSRLSDAGGGGMPATPHFVPTALVRGYYISGHEAPQPVLRTIFYPAMGGYIRQKDIKIYISITYSFVSYVLMS